MKQTNSTTALPTILVASLVIVVATQTNRIEAAKLDQPTYSTVWLRVKPDERLGFGDGWQDLGANSLEPMQLVLDDRFRSPRVLATDLHLYRLVPIDLTKPIGDLKLAWGEKLYLTDEDLMASR